MYLKQSTYKNGRTFLSINRKYRDGGRIREVTVEKIGYLDDLEKKMDDPISFYRAKAESLTKQHREENLPVSFTIDPSEMLSKDGPNLFSLGYMFPMAEYYGLDIDYFFKKKSAKLSSHFNLNTIFSFLVFSRIIRPASKISTFRDASFYFERFSSIHRDDMYRALDLFAGCSEEFQKFLNQSITSRYGRDISRGYYDCTNFYFEIRREDDPAMDPDTGEPGIPFRSSGPSKEHRRTPIVQMGLLMDNNGIPMAFDMFPGRKSEKLSLQPVLKRCRRDYGLDRIIVVADRGLNTGDNLFQIMGKHDGYIMSKSIAGASGEFKKWVLDDKGYRETRTAVMKDDGSYEQAVTFRIKSRISPEKLTYHDSDGHRRKCSHDQRQVVFWSSDYAKRAAIERQKAIDKARDMIENRGKYTQATTHGAAGYVRGLKFDKKTGAIISDHLELDVQRIEEEEKYDGYYCIVSSELSMAEDDIIEAYRGLWKIEESFKITKTGFDGRPVYLQTEAHIRAHFLICYVALVLMRLIEYRLKGGYSVLQICKSLRQMTCSHAVENYYLCQYYDDIIEKLVEIYGLDLLGRKWLTREQIKKMSAKAKK